MYITGKKREIPTSFCGIRIDDENVVQMISNFHKEVKPRACFRDKLQLRIVVHLLTN